MTNSKFLSYLNKGNCFKLICGAGNQNYDEITTLCHIYSGAGCRFFDVNASIEAIQAAKKGIKQANINDQCFICISIGTKNDPHISKYMINTKDCYKCKKCESICPQNAINNFKIDAQKCIGCKKCFNICKNNAIESYSIYESLNTILPPLIKEGIDCIEYHITGEKETVILNGFQEIIKLYNGPISISINRKNVGDKKLIEILQKLKNITPNIFIIQADGNPMSGGENDFNTTLQAVAMADIINKSSITPYVFISGGTNSKTAELAALCEIKFTGIAVGSYARKIVREYITSETLFKKATHIAKELIKSCSIK